ncbi:Ribosomal protein L7Ae [Psychrobacillus sp. OK028]|uniref:YlxQ family RNA-binding protein n=1 Tax=Psychrobacillus sp. OK028 TaxID=1884359 RepID=UPI00088265E1|nr:YlxQ family RNA-binding protein [Psychrobacillus sp. OK028]SDM56556.1 Ribosomal protein L7Ae [Psychrobacillus sp. OK028]
MTIDEQISNLLGLATRARKTITGEELVVKEIRSQKAKLVVLSNDASKNTAKKINDKCASFNVELHVFGDRHDLGHATGKEARVAIAIMDDGFAKKLSGLLNEYNRG